MINELVVPSLLALSGVKNGALCIGPASLRPSAMVLFVQIMCAMLRAHQKEIFDQNSGHKLDKTV